jgi:hypothetical protein
VRTLPTWKREACAQEAHRYQGRLKDTPSKQFLEHVLNAAMVRYGMGYDSVTLPTTLGLSDKRMHAIYLKVECIFERAVAQLT